MVIWLGSAALFATGLILVGLRRDTAVLGLLASAYLLCSRLILRPEMTRAHREGVVIQEWYDTSLFGLAWNEGLAGKEPSIIDIEDLAGRFRGDTDDLAEWYERAQGAPSPARVVLRQLENATWGRLDHRRFSVFTAVILVLSIAATVIAGLLRDVTLAVYVSALAAPALPWLLDLADLTALHWRAAGRRAEIEAEMTALWKSMSGDSLTSSGVLRTAQDRLFAVRRSSGRVPTWFYRIYRRRNHRAFAAAAERMLRAKGWSGER